MQMLQRDSASGGLFCLDLGAPVTLQGVFGAEYPVIVERQPYAKAGGRGYSPRGQNTAGGRGRGDAREFSAGGRGIGGSHGSAYAGGRGGAGMSAAGGRGRGGQQDSYTGGRGGARGYSGRGSSSSDWRASKSDK